MNKIKTGFGKNMTFSDFMLLRIYAEKHNNNNFVVDGNDPRIQTLLQEIKANYPEIVQEAKDKLSRL